MTLAIILAIVGLILIYTEYFVTGGIVLTLGILALIASVVLFILQDYPIYALIIYLAALILTIVGVCRFALYRIRRKR